MVTKVSESLMTNNDIFQTGDYKEPENIESNNFTDKEQNPNNSDSAINESHDNSNHGIFCVTEKDLDLIDIDELF